MTDGENSQYAEKSAKKLNLESKVMCPGEQ